MIPCGDTLMATAYLLKLSFKYILLHTSLLLTSLFLFIISILFYFSQMDFLLFSGSQLFTLALVKVVLQHQQGLKRWIPNLL